MQNFHQVPLRHRNEETKAEILRDAVTGYFWAREIQTETANAEIL